MSAFIRDLLGQRFGKLVVIKDSGKRTKGHNVKWACKCDCGKTTIVGSSNLTRKNKTKSCGCGMVIHGHRRSKKCGGRSRTYNTWCNMKSRCTKTKHHGYPNYGGRNITIYEPWLKFKNFLKDMGERPKGTTIDRINVDGNYEPSNCRWATIIEQANNKRKRKKPSPEQIQ